MKACRISLFSGDVISSATSLDIAGDTAECIALAKQDPFELLTEAEVEVVGSRFIVPRKKKVLSLFVDSQKKKAARIHLNTASFIAIGKGEASWAQHVDVGPVPQEWFEGRLEKSADVLQLLPVPHQLFWAASPGARENGVATMDITPSAVLLVAGKCCHRDVRKKQLLRDLATTCEGPCHPF